MRLNEYKNLEEFIDEYAYGKSFSWQNEDHKERFRGIDFTYNNTIYRLCNEPLREDQFPILENGEKGKYCTYIMHNMMRNVEDDEIIELGWYIDLYDALDNWIIEGKSFREVIMDDNTIIEGKD